MRLTGAEQTPAEESFLDALGGLEIGNACPGGENPDGSNFVKRAATTPDEVR